MSLIRKQDWIDAGRAARAAFSWPVFWSVIGVFSLIGLLSWIGMNADPRYSSRCSEPGDFGFLLFFLSLPVIGSCALVGLGEGVLWGRNREHHPELARRHFRRAATLLGIGFACCLGVALGFLSLCRFL